MFSIAYLSVHIFSAHLPKQAHGILVLHALINYIDCE